MKTTLSARPIASAVFAAALALGFAGTAAAQQNNGGGTVGGSSTDDTSAGNVNGTGMPQIQQQGDVSFVSGGVGQDESKALQRAEHHWPLALRFTGRGGEFLADVRVQIANGHGDNLLEATSRGPYMLVKLPPGHYTVHASHAGVEKTSAVTVGEGGSAHASFNW
jgi:hypothetical protein